jgi:hypothetical protein
MDDELKQQSLEFMATLVNAADNVRMMRAMVLAMTVGVLPQEHFQDDIATLYRNLNSFVMWIEEIQRDLMPKCGIEAADTKHVLH